MTLKEKYKTLTKSNMKTQIESRFFVQIYTTHNIVNKNGRQCYQLQAKKIIDDRRQTPNDCKKNPNFLEGHIRNIPTWNSAITVTFGF